MADPPLFCTESPRLRGVRRHSPSKTGVPPLWARLDPSTQHQIDLPLHEHHLPYVDVAGQEARLAVGQVVLPRAPEALVETERRERRPGGAEALAPLLEGARIVLAEDARADQWQVEALAKAF